MMRRRFFGLVLLTIVSACSHTQQPVTAAGIAPDMVNGTWRGWLLPTGEDSIRVTYDVSHYKEHLLITLRGRSGLIYDMSGAKVKNDVLTFDWPMGLNSNMFCRLTRRDGKTFEGTCNDHSPGPVGKPIRVWMLMNPPARDSSRTGDR
jgi:hypothetical protein